MKIRNSQKLGLVEKIALGAGSAVLTASGTIIPGLITHWEPGYLSYSLAAPLVATGIDFAIQKVRNPDNRLLSKKYAKALGVSVVGAGIAYAAMAASAYIYFKYYFTLGPLF